MRNYLHMKLDALAVARQNSIDENTAIVPCESCGNNSDVLIDVNGVTEFKCEKCHSTNMVTVNLKVINKTIPMDGLLTETLVKKMYDNG